MIETVWGDTARYGSIEPQPAERTPEEQAEIEKLEARQAELAETADEDWTEELLAQAEAIETRLDDIEARATWKREDFQMAGCLVTVGHDGALQGIQGLVKPEDMPKETGTGDTGNATDDASEPDATGRQTQVAGPTGSTPMAPPRDRDSEARKEAGVGIGLADDLRHIWTALIEAYLAGDFAAAFDLLLFQMGRSVFTFGYTPRALDISVRQTADRPTTRINDEEFETWLPGEAMLADRSGLSLDWLEIGDDGESFAALRTLPQADKQALFVACVARTVDGADEPDGEWRYRIAEGRQDDRRDLGDGQHEHRAECDLRQPGRQHLLHRRCDAGRVGVGGQRRRQCRHRRDHHLQLEDQRQALLGSRPRLTINEPTCRSAFDTDAD